MSGGAAAHYFVAAGCWMGMGWLYGGGRKDENVAGDKVRRREQKVVVK